MSFANYALNELGHDEGMYLGASYLAIEHELYSEIGYFQAPNLPLLLSRFYAWSGVSEEFLLWGRMVTFVHHALTLALLAAIAWHYTRSSTVSFLFTMWIGLNGFLMGAGYSIDNTTYASMYWLAGYYVSLRAHQRGWPSSLMLTAGFLVALAPGFKLNYFPLFACFVVALAVYAPRRAIGVFLAGSVIGFAPSLYMLADRAAVFWFDNVTWHRALLAMNVEARGAHAMVAEFATDAWLYLTSVTWLATLVVLAPVAIGLFISEGKTFWTFDRTLLALGGGASLVTILGLGAVRFWYLQPVAIVGALLVPSVYSQLGSRRQTALRWMLVVAVAVGARSQTSSLKEAPHLLEMRRWVPVRYAQVGTTIAGLAPRARAESVAVIGNPAIVYGVEGGLPLTRSAATGAFLRISSPMLLRDDRIETYAGLSDRKLEMDMDMIIATVDYLTPHTRVEPGAWCDADLPGGGGELVARWCDAGYRHVVVGEGPARAVVFYK